MDDKKIVIKCLCSTVPGYTWRSQIEIIKRQNQTEIWSSPDIDEYGFELIHKIKGNYRNKKVIEYFSTSDTLTYPLECFQYIKINGFDKFWYPYLIISLSDEYSELVPELLTFDKKSLIQFTTTNGELTKKNNILNIGLLKKIKKYLEKITDLTQKQQNLKQIFDIHQENTILDLSFIKNDILKLKIKENEKYKKQRILDKIKQKEDKIKLKLFSKDINLYLSNFKNYTELNESDFIDRVVSRYVNEFVLENSTLPGETVFIHKKGVYINQYRYIISGSSLIKGFRMFGKIYFKKLKDDFKEKLKHV